MGATKESPATQVLTWAVEKLDEASKIDWVEKLNTLAASKPAYLKNAVSAPASLRALTGGGGGGSGVSPSELEAALRRASAAEARADGLARRVAQLESQLAATNSHSEGPRSEVTVPDDRSAEGEDDEHHKSHWWSRHH